jgi:hypothetical protein
MPREQVNRGIEVRRTIQQSDQFGTDAAEIITHRPYIPNEMMSTDEELHEVPSFHVAWYPGAIDVPNVEVIIEVDMAWMAEYVDAWRAHTLPGHSTDGERDAKAVVHARLTDRREVNKAIATLRRARDKVFGPDE